MYNKIILIGNLGRDPEIRRLESGAVVANFSLATNENYRDKAGNWQTITEWHNVVAWRNLAERAERDLKTGSMVFVEGKLTTRKWQDKDGNDRYTTEVLAAVIRPLDKKDGAAPLSEGMTQRSGLSPNVNTNMSESNTSKTDNVDDDLPF
ncbi:MAG: single-stranded DNA-binding protein [Saprospiraceae bacterium]|jgi:single-strand DNA-binding protein|nr:single-stranded DNA-binding protein [Chitinophagia bacterium]